MDLVPEVLPEDPYWCLKLRGSEEGGMAASHVHLMVLHWKQLYHTAMLAQNALGGPSFWEGRSFNAARR